MEAGNGLTRGGPLVYTGAQILDTSVLHEIDDTVFSLNECWDILAARGELHGVVYPGRWCDVGTPEALAHAQRLLEDDHG
jgi:MurNAc alpha-1-phosphate uridylyltransferase